MTTEREHRAARRAVRAEYGDLFDAVAAILFRLDPIGINFGSNTDEYEPEAGTILPWLRQCSNVEDVQRTVYEEFYRWFDAKTAGDLDRYAEAAVQIWSLVGSRRKPDR